MSEEKTKSEKTGELFGKVLGGCMWAVYIGGMISMITSTLITPLPITSVFITLFGWYAVFIAILVAVITFTVARLMKKNESETLKVLWKADLHKKSTVWMVIGNVLNFSMSTFALFVMGDMSLFLKLFSMTVVTNLFGNQMRRIVKKIKKNEGLYKFIDGIGNLKDLFEKYAEKEIDKK